eukprot:m.8860 g.8860  ORF g.8860 m.8860 type:complete len:1121 (-) comp2904_c0_seq1:341-3703(-)
MPPQQPSSSATSPTGPPPLPTTGPRDALTGASASPEPDQLLSWASAPLFHHTAEAVLSFLGVSDPEAGLSDAEAADRRRIFGTNALREVQRRSAAAIVFAQLVNPVVAILAVVFAIAIINEEWIEAVVVVLVIALNSGIGIVQELHAEASLAAIRELGGKATAAVTRHGETISIPAEEVVLGDIVELRAGQLVPADLRLISVNRLEIDESVLTGEGLPVEKQVEPLPVPQVESGSASLTASSSSSENTASAAPPPSAAVALGDRKNMAYRQTTVMMGVGRGVVVATGAQTEMGKIADRLAGKGSGPPKTPLTRSMERLFLMLLAIGVVFGVFIIWAFHWEVNKVSLLYASATLVAILPEAVIVVITVTMAIGARRMAARNAIVRKLAALEQLGRVTDICSDKTGTLTLGRMQPARLLLHLENKDTGSPTLVHLRVSGPALSSKATWHVALPEDAPHSGSPLSPTGEAIDVDAWLHNSGVFQKDISLAFETAIQACALCASVRLRRRGERSPTTGNGANVDADALEGAEGANPTEVALQELAHKAAASVPELGDHLWSAWQSRGEWSFTSSAKRMSVGVRHRTTGQSAIFTKGAPERVLPLCVNLDDAAIDRTHNAASALASNGLRVLALAYRTDLDLSQTTLGDIERADVERNLLFLGLVAVRDPPKPESQPAVAECHTAGITVRMLTGDHPETALAIAKEIGILPAGITSREAFASGIAMTGPQLDSMDPAELDALPELPLVVARSSPESKVSIVDALHRRSLVVAMTGDGVNDSPAIRAADVGIAMGITGSDVTKGVADLILADDNFATIVAAIREGRRIFDSIKHFVVHLLSGNVAEAVVLMLSLSFVVDSDDVPVFVLSPLAILYLNTATGSGPAIGLALETAAPDLMLRPPRRRGLYTPELLTDCAVYGGIMGALSLLAFSAVAYWDGDGNFGIDCNTSDGVDCDNVLRARGAAFLVLNTLLLLHAYSCRHHRRSAFSSSFTDNKVLLWSLIIGTAVVIPWMYIPWLNEEVFKHTYVTWEWGLALAACVVYMLGAELHKFVKRCILPCDTVGRENVAIVPGGANSSSASYDKLKMASGPDFNAAKKATLPAGQSSTYDEIVLANTAKAQRVTSAV